MDGSQLLSNISFDEARKGYDRDQVDTFLRGLSEKVGELQQMLRTATERAESADAKVAEALRQKAKAEQDADAARVELAKARATGADEDAEIVKLRDMLKLAQKTADAAVEEANGKAKEIVSDARSKAAMMIVDAEQEIERIKAEAQRRADELVDERARNLVTEKELLETRHAELSAEVAALEARLGDRRRGLADAVAELQRVLDGPALDVPAFGVPGDEVTVDEAVVDEVIADDPGSSTEPVEGPEGPEAKADVAALIEGPVDGEPGLDEPVVAEPVVAEPAEAAPEPPARVIDLTAPPLFEAPSGDDPAGDDAGGPPTQAVDLFGDSGPATGATPVITFGAPPEPEAAPVVTREELDLRSTTDVRATASVFGQAGAEDDAAMQAFFEQDLDALAKTSPRGRFLRRS